MLKSKEHSAVKNIQTSQSDDPLHKGGHQAGHQKRTTKLVLFFSLALLTLVLATIWAIYDVGWYVGPWGKLAFVALTWLALAVALYNLFFRGRD